MSFETFYQSNRKSFLLNATQSEPIPSASETTCLGAAGDHHHSTAGRQTAHSNVYDYILSISSDLDDGPAAHSPYRTASHFGFNSPRRNARPLHFHVSTATSQYVAIPRALSIGELFANDQMLECADTNVVNLMQRTMRRQRSRVWMYPTGWQMPQMGGYLDRLLTVKRWLEPNAPEATAVEQVEQRVESPQSVGNRTFDKSGDDETEEEDGGQKDTLCPFAVDVDIHAAMHDAPSSMRCLTPIPEDQDNSLSDREVKNKTHEAHTISKQLIDSILQTLELDKENLAIAHPQTKLQNATILGNNTFVQKINEMNYSNESPNVEYQKQRQDDLANARKALERRHMREINQTVDAGVRGSHKRQIMGRVVLHHRREELVDIWEDHSVASSLPAERPMTTGSECSDMSALDPLEQKILTQIDANALDQYDGIFAKIKNSILESNNSKMNNSFVEAPFEDLHSSEMPFGSLTGSAMSLESAPSERQQILQNALFTQHPDEPVFVPNARNSSTPKTKAAVAATLKTLHSSSEWAMNRSADKPKSSPASVNVSKTRLHHNRAVRKILTPSPDATPTAVFKQKPKHQRNFIQENIENAAQKKARQTANKSNPKSSRNQSKQGAAITPRSNLGTIFPPPSPYAKHATASFNKNCSDNVANCMWMIDRPPLSDATATDVATSNSDPTTSTTSDPTSSATTSDPLDLDEIQAKIDVLIAGMSSASSLDNGEPEVHDWPMTQQTDDIMQCIEQCGKHLTELRIDRVASELDEIMELHELTEQEMAAQKLANEAELREKWVRYNELMFSLSEEED